MSTQPMDTGDLELGLLRTFLAAVDCGSLRKTAAAIDKTQPAVSAQMLRLEKIVGHKLFARGRNGITLTHHGELLMAYANRAVDLNDEILVRLRGERPGGRVAIGMSSGVAMAGLGPAMKRFQAFHPDVELRVVVAAAPELDPLLTAGELHLAISEPPLMRRSPSARWQMPLERAAQKHFKVEQFQSLPLVCSRGRAPGRMICWILYAEQGASGVSHSRALAWMRFSPLRSRASALPLCRRKWFAILIWSL